jgi:squalene-hopene/tetraprenyl-beta-curcumene cyclase
VNTSTYEHEVKGEKRTYVVGSDGGAIYGPGMSKAPDVKRADGRLEFQSYGSMTYALLKCLIFAGVDPKDPRMVLALKWISDHFTVDRNPGFEGGADPEKDGQQGYYYYLYTATRALQELERATGTKANITDAQGRKHDWRREMAEALLERQGEAGSWVNAVDRWEEGSDLLATSYAVQSLAFITGRLP